MSKISYLKGLMEGLGVHPESREGKLYYAICAALDENAEYIQKLENRVAELEELCEILDEDLGSLEELVDSEEYGCASCPSEHKQSFRFEEDKAENAEEADDFLDEEEYETVCPTCGQVILLNEQMLEDGETVCPNCGEELEFDFDEEEVQRLAPEETAAAGSEDAEE